MAEDATNISQEDNFNNLLKSIDSENYSYVMPIIEEQKISYKQFKMFDRYYLEKLFEIGSFNHIRELGREVEFIEKYIIWRNNNNSSNLTTHDHQNCKNNDLSALTYNLNDVFKNNPIFCELKTFYDKHGHLGNTEQNKLTRAVIDFYVSKNIRLEASFFQNLASQIHQLFPNEAEEIYFEKQKHHRAKGKLFYRYQNATNASAKPYNKPQKLMEKSVTFVGNEQESSKIKSYLKYNFQDKEQTCEKWKQTVKYRLNEILNCRDSNIKNIVDSWPAYRQYFAPELISIDFEILYPLKINNFFLNWTKLNEILPIYINLNLKDSRLKALWAEAKEKWINLDQNSKDAIFIYIIHGVLKPDKMQKGLGRPTIADSQTSVIKVVEEDIEVDFYSGEPPFIIIKSNLFSVKSIFVVTDRIIYKANTVVSALALCFQMYQIFNLSYNSKCINFWLFIQKILFDINLQSDVVGSNLKAISAFFKAHN